MPPVAVTQTVRRLSSLEGGIGVRERSTTGRQAGRQAGERAGSDADRRIGRVAGAHRVVDGWVQRRGRQFEAVACKLKRNLFPLPPARISLVHSA